MIVVLAAALLAGGCSADSVGDTYTNLSSRQIKVVTTTSMVTDLVERSAASASRSTGLMGPGVDPHLYKASEGDVIALADADVVFYNGLHLEAKMATSSSAWATRPHVRGHRRDPSLAAPCTTGFRGRVRPARLVRRLALEAGRRAGARRPEQPRPRTHADLPGERRALPDAELAELDR